MKHVKLTNSDLVCVVDERDYEKVCTRNWRATFSRGKAYAVSGASQPPYQDYIEMHNFIMGDPPEGFKWDHKNRDGLDNQQENLRLATRSQNKANGDLYRNSTSGYKGVTLRKERGTWRAQIRQDGKLTIIGCFNDIEQAARAYDRAAIRMFGSFARTNFSYSQEEITSILNQGLTTGAV